MMGRVKTIKCPNCGANTTNTRNCEYCGSLLVRFEDKGIDLSQTSYLDDANTYPNIENALKMNLLLQKKNPGQSVVTDIYYFEKGESIGALPCVLRNNHASFEDGTNIPSESNKGFCVIENFGYFVNNNRRYVKFNEEQEKLHQKFKSLDIYPLFLEHVSVVEEEGEDAKIYEYFIDFGEDVTGAARLLSKLISEVYGLPLDAQIECYTNVGDNIEINRRKINEMTGGDIGGQIVCCIGVTVLSFTFFAVLYKEMDIDIKASLSIALILWTYLCSQSKKIVELYNKLM